MIFKRRRLPSVSERVREAVYPRKGWLRPWEYIAHRLKRLPDPPEKIALGIAIGTFVSFTPLFGFHFVLAVLIAWALRANIPASIFGTFFGNPVTLPFIAAASMSFGRRLLGFGAHHGEFAGIREAFVDGVDGMWQSAWALFGYGPTAWDKVAEFWTDLFLPYLVGGILPGVIAGAGCYFLSKPLISAYQVRRRHRLIARAKERLAQRGSSMQAGGAS